MPSELALLEEAALKEHLASIKDLVPLDQEGGFEARGYVDEAGNVTESGNSFLDLEDSGIFDGNGNLTPKGQAFAMDRSEALMERNLPVYITRQKAGLDDAPDASFGDILAQTGGYVWDAVKGTGRLLKLSAERNTPLGWLRDDALTEAETLLAKESFAEGAIGAGASLFSGIDRMNMKLWTDPDDENEMAYWASKQKFDRFADEQEDLEAADYMAVLSTAQGAVMDAERAKAGQRLGEARTKEITSEGRAAGNLVGDPSNLATFGAGFVVGSAEKLPILARLSAKAEQATQAALRAEQLSVQLAKARNVADKSGRALQVASRMADDLAGTGNVARADQFRSVATRLGTQADESARAIPMLEAQAADAAAHAQKLAEASGGAQRVMAAIDQMKQVGRQVRSAPARAMAPVLESIGEGMMKADSWIEAHAKTLAQTRGAGALIGLGTGNPLYALPQLLAAGPVVRGIGNFTRVLGDELMQARGTSPFWRRVAENSNTTPLGRALSHGMDFATLGGKVPTAIRNTARGVAAAAPVDMAFEVIGSGGDMSPNTLKQGLAESLIFGGGGALGGAMFKGNLNDLRARAAGDEINFRRTLSPEKTKLFSAMNQGARKNLSIYAATFPNLKFEITDSGPSSFNRQTNTATINARQSDWLKPVIAHEVNHFLQVSGQMEEGIRAMLMGDGTTGGLLRSKDGTLDGNFRRFGEEYNGRLQRDGIPPLSPDDLAIEYFTEATVDQLVSDTDSGRLQALARRSKGEKALHSLIESVVPKLPIIRNLFIRTGGALDSKGNVVHGNGLLAGGVRELPGAKAMLRKMMKEQAGRGRETRLPPTQPGKIEITSPTEQKPLVDSMFSLFETDSEGNVLTDEKGVPQVITRETEKKRATAGKEAAAVIDKEIEAEADSVTGNPVTDPQPLDLSDPITAEEAQSETPEQKSRRVKRKPTGNYEGTHFSPKALQAIRRSQKLNKLQMQVLRMLNRASRDMTGETFSVINHPALKTDQFGRKTYQALGATTREVVPIGLQMNKKGAVSVVLLSVTQLVENIRNRAASPKGKLLYNGNEMAIREDVEAVINLHREGLKTDAYFSGKYGAKGPQYKNFINGVLPLDAAAQREANPAFAEDEINSKTDRVVRSYRIDRISRAARLQGRTPLPFQYESVKANLLPLGVPEGRGRGMPQKSIYHATGNKFSDFDLSKMADGTVWFTDNLDKIKRREVGASGDGFIMERLIDEGRLKLATWDDIDKYSVDELIAQGFDGVKMEEEGETTYQIFHPEKLDMK